MKLVSRLCILVIGFTAYSLANKSGDDTKNFQRYLHSHPAKEDQFEETRKKVTLALSINPPEEEYVFTAEGIIFILNRSLYNKSLLFVSVIPRDLYYLHPDESLFIRALIKYSMLYKEDRDHNVIKQVNLELYHDKLVQVFK